MSKKFRIGILVGHQLSRTYGEGHVLCDLQDMLSDSVHFDLVGGGAIDDNIAKKFKNYNYFGIRPLGHPLLNALMWPLKFLNCTTYVLRNKPDALFNIGSPGVLGLIAAINGRILGIPVAVRTPGNTMGMYRHQKRFLRRLKAILTQRYFCKVSLMLSRLVLTLGEGLKNNLVLEGIPSDKIRTIPQPIRVSRFNAGVPRDQARSELDLPKNTQIALFVGRLEAEKGTKLLVDIAQEMSKVDGNTMFVVVGAGPLEPLLQAESNVRLIGFVPHKDILKYYNAADVLISTSQSEGIPNVMLEAMAAGIPILSTPSSDEVSRMVSNICFSKDDFKKRLLKKEFKADALPNIFEWTVMKKQYIIFFKELVN